MQPISCHQSSKNFANSCFGCLLLLLCSCTTSPIQRELIAIETVGDVALNQAAATPTDNELLEVGILVFAANNIDQERYQLGDWVFDEILQNETQFLPHLLKQTLLESNQWGAVRVIPESDPSLDVLLTGEIINSDGRNLILEITATDSSGRQWLKQSYADLAGFSDYPESTRFTLEDSFDARNFTDPFQDIYNQIANDLLAARNNLGDEILAEINLVTQMKYASDLAPDTFSHTLEQDADGLLAVTSLLADNDPMLARVADIQYRHHLFIDTVDEYYETLYNDIKPAYVLWRRYSIDEVIETEETQLEAEVNNYGTASSFLSLSQRYDRFKWSKIFEREFIELASGFNTELAPAMLELNTQVHGLNGTMEQQYREWRGVLKSLFELETGQSTSGN